MKQLRCQPRSTLTQCLPSAQINTQIVEGGEEKEEAGCCLGLGIVDTNLPTKQKRVTKPERFAVLCYVLSIMRQNQTLQTMGLHCRSTPTKQFCHLYYFACAQLLTRHTHMHVGCEAPHVGDQHLQPGNDAIHCLRLSRPQIVNIVKVQQGLHIVCRGMRVTVCPRGQSPHSSPYWACNNLVPT